MTKLSLSSAKPLQARADALIIGLFAAAGASSTGGRNGTPTTSLPEFDDVVTAATTLGATGRIDEITILPAPAGIAAAKVIVVGLGTESDLDGEIIRRAAAIASRRAAGDKKIVSTLAHHDLAAAAQGHLLGTYDFTTYKTPTKRAVDTVVLSVPKSDKATRATLGEAVTTARAVLAARDFVNTAPNDLPPAVFADRAAQAAREAGLTVQVLTEKALERGGYGGILGVGSGSARPPRLVRITHRPATSRATVALVGKGVTFDSGGLSIKPAAGMDHMTNDMAGAAAVAATMVAVAELDLPITVTATIPMAENLPSGSAYRPGDVLRMRGGKTVHVLNTDAEGRLILADAITRACEDDPDYLLETSTLTGAQMVALGSRTMGVMGTPALRDRVAELGREVGEGAWAMPLPAELRKGLDSPLADLANVSGNRAGGMLVAGHFLREFIADGVSWAHLDVAGPAYNANGAHGYTSTGGTGVPVRTLLATLADIAAGADLHTS